MLICNKVVHIFVYTELDFKVKYYNDTLPYIYKGVYTCHNVNFNQIAIMISHIKVMTRGTATSS